MTDQTPDLGHEAAGYALLGWPVFPLAPGGKVPLYHSPHPRGSQQRRTCRGGCGRYGHGVLDATTNPDVIRLWWTRQPQANIGIATGYPGPDVVDVDVKAGAPGLATWRRLGDAGLIPQSTMRVRTASGGWHIYYEGTSQGNSTRKKDGIDFRGAGGYVVAPPSIVAGHRYQIEKAALHDNQVDWAAIRAYLEPPRLQPALSQVERTLRYGPPTFDGLIGFVTDQTQGNRNSALHWAACRMVEQGATRSDLERLIDAGAQTVGGGEHEARRTVNSAVRTQILQAPGDR